MSNCNGNGRNGNGKARPRSNGSVEGLWQQFLGSGRSDIELRNRLVEQYLVIAEGAAARAKKKVSVDYDDLFQMAVVGLMAAVQLFDPDKGVKFETFASHRVSGSIIDALRKQDWVPRALRRLDRELAGARYHFISVHDREPTIEELAKKLDLPEAKIKESMDQNFLVTSLDLVDDNDRRLIQPVSDEIDESELFIGLEAVSHFLKGLSDLERTIILMYYDEGFSMLEIANMLNLSESRISQVTRGIILFLRQRMRAEGVPT